MADRAFRATSHDGFAWEIYQPLANGRASVTRWERVPGEYASRIWTKQMSRQDANARAIDERARGWKIETERCHGQH